MAAKRSDGIEEEVSGSKVTLFEIKSSSVTILAIFLNLFLMRPKKHFRYIFVYFLCFWTLTTIIFSSSWTCLKEHSKLCIKHCMESCIASIWNFSFTFYCNVTFLNSPLYFLNMKQYRQTLFKGTVWKILQCSFTHLPSPKLTSELWLPYSIEKNALENQQARFSI